MVVLNGRQSMFECKVLYIGSAAPTKTLSGTDALQEPLRQRYPGDLTDVAGIDSHLRVKADCLEMIHAGSSHVIQFPLDRLKICAAVRCVTSFDATSGDTLRQFVPLNTLSPDSSEPAIFTAIIRREKGREIAECHMFVCRSPRDALHLVNTTAAANLNLKALRGQSMSETVKYQNGVPVIHDVREAHTAMNGEDVRYVTAGSRDEQYNGDDNTVYIKSSIVHEHGQEEVPQEPVRHYVDNNYEYAQQTHEEERPKQNVIYVTLDKSNLVQTGERTLEVQPTNVQYPPARPRPMVMQSPPRFMQGPPPMPVAYRRPMMVRPPMMVGPPPPPRMMMVRPPTQAQVVQGPPRMYTRRVMSPPPRVVAAPPVYYKSRARSTSPEYTQSEIRARVVRQSKHQPKWRSHSSDILEYHRPDTAPPGVVYQSPGMFMNERAFSRRVNTDQRFSGYSTPGHNNPTAYDFHDVMMYDRPISKSNPRYSSSSSEEGDDLRFSRKKR